MKNNREYPNRPIVAVSGVIMNRNKEVLIVRRAKPPGEGLWSLPGGAVKLGEKLINALKREIKEECNISIEVLKFLGAFDRIYVDENEQIRFHYIILDYLCSTKEEVIIPTSDVDNFTWISPKTIDNYDYTSGVKDFLIDGFNQGWFESTIIK
jgi:ADP-ribose pyrophosphatase YjhB (NUDIX family)